MPSKKRFSGIEDSETFTSMPDSLFSDFLGDARDLSELKVALYAIWRLQHVDSGLRALSREDFPESELGLDAAQIDRGLNAAVEHKALLRAADGRKTRFLLNSVEGRAAAQELSNGTWRGDQASSTPLEHPSIFGVYEQNIGPLTPLIADALKDAEASFPAEWITEAIDLAVRNNKRSWSYCEAILRRWKEEGRGASRIDETIRQLASETLKRRSADSSAAEVASDMLGDPKCPHCHGIGYLRKDVPVGHPEFGEVFVCVCRRRQVASVARDRLFALSHLDELRALTFETFKPRGRPGIGERQASSLQVAYNQARHHAENLKGWLFLQGAAGCGKTHLAAAAANFAVDLGVPTLFLTVPDLLDTLRASYSSEDTTFEQRFDDIRSAQLLVLDDFGTQNASPWAREKLFQIMNHRYINKLPTIVTTNMLLGEIEERIRSRLADPDLVTQVRILAPDYRRPMDDTSHPELSSLDLHSRRTFDTFTLRKEESLNPAAQRSLKDALSAAREFAQDPRGWLIVSGDYASGKTHLAAAIANELAQKGEPPLFVMVPDLLDHLRATFSPTSSATFDRRFEEIRTTGLLILDDLGTQSMTPWVREKLYQLFGYRANAELPTVITIAADSLASLDPRLASRLRDEHLCRIVSMAVPPFRGTAPHPKPRPTRSR